MKKIIVIMMLAICTSVAAYAQKGNIGFVYPGGARKGSTIELTVGGQGLGSAKGIIVSGEGVTGELIAAPAGQKNKKRKTRNIGEEDNLQLSDLVKFRLTVDKDATPGIRDVRLVLANGLSNRLYFEVGELPDVVEIPKASLSASAERLPVCFNGQITNRDVDSFRFPARAGQQLVIRVKARILVPYLADAVPGWFQPIIRLFGPDGKELAYNDDYGHQVDPVLFFKVPRSGDYEIRINDALYRGREDFVYRIDVGELPFITSISPIGCEGGRKATLTLRGYNLPSKTLKIKARKSGVMTVSVKGKDGMASNTMMLDVTDLHQLRLDNDMDNSRRSRALPMGIGEVCEQKFTSHMQQYWYELTVPKRMPVHFEVKARCLGAPTDARMTLFSSDGNLVKDVDDFENPDDYLTTHFADPQITIQLNPGKYYVRLTEAQGHFGEDYAFRFSVEESVPDFSLNIEPSNFSVPVNGTGMFSVMLNRKQNFRGEVTLDMRGLPSGFKYTAFPIAPGQKKTFVTVTAPVGAKQEAAFPKVSGTANAKDLTISRDAKPVETMMQAFYYTHYLPVEEFRMEVAKEQPFRIRIDKTWKNALCLTPESEIAVKVRIERNPGYTSPVTVMLKSSLNGVKASAVVIPENGNEATLNITVAGKRKNKKDMYGALCVYGVVKASSKKIQGKGRNAYAASVTAYAPVFEGYIPAVGRR